MRARKKPSALLHVCLAAAALFTCNQAVGAESSRPNVVIIYTDDQGYGDSGCYNPECKFPTPNIDALAKGGVRFTDGHSSDSVCSPSRYGLLTGRYSWRTELKKGVLGAEHKCLITDDRPTLATVLRDNGYATAMVGKWHLGMDFPGDSPANRDWTQPTRDMPLDKGFESFFGIPASLNYGVLAWFDGRHAAVPPTVFTAKKPNSRHVDYRIKPPYQAVASDVRARNNPVIEVAPDFIDNQCLTRFTDKAIDFVAGCSTKTDSKKIPHKPFFLYLPLTSPHYPVCPLPEFHGQGDCGGYGEFMIETDYHVGRVVDALKAAGQFENTLIIFSSDNGPEKSWKQRVKEFKHESNRGLREGKRSIYEGGHRVPFIAHWPSGIEQPGRTSSRPVCQTDIFATVADILALPTVATRAEDSESFLPVLVSTSESPRATPLIHHSVSGQFAIRSGDYKLVLPEGDRPAELYNLAKDLREKNNIIRENADVAKRLEALATNVIASGRTTPGPKSSNDTPHWSHLNWITPEQYNSFR